MGEDAAPAEARATIERQAKEIDELRHRLEQETAAQDLRGALVLATSAGTIGSPVKSDRLLEMMIGTAMQIVGADSASLYAIKERTEELSIEIAVGPKAEEVKGLRVPLGQGIAGLVAVSGQAMAVADAEQDPRVLAEIGERIGYRPKNIVAVPLSVQDRVIGVLQLLDKTDTDSFSAQDMEMLGLFAGQIAAAIELTRTYKRLGPLLTDALNVAAGAGLGPEQRRRSATYAITIEDEPSYLETMELASLVQEIAWQGDHELKVCQQILRSFAEFLRSRPDPFGGEE
ncbi:MAG: GAF domain-containing protein [Actinomycetota bacterium]